MIARKAHRGGWLKRHYRKVVFPAVMLVILAALGLTMALPAGAATIVHESYTTGWNGSINIEDHSWAQTFTTGGSAHDVDAVNIMLQCTHYDGNVTAIIRATSSGLPSGPDLCSGTIHLTDESTDTWYQIDLGSGASLNASTMYALIVNAEEDTTGSDYVAWRYDSDSGPNYSGGNISHYDSDLSTWIPASADNDFMFQVLEYMCSVGPNYAQTGTSVDTGSVWMFPENIDDDDGNVTWSYVPSWSNSQYLYATNFGLDIPTGVTTIEGIEVTMQRRTWSYWGIIDDEVKLLKGGIIVGDNRAFTGGSDYWPYNNMETVTYGDETDTWGTTWTPAQIEASNFGVAVRVDNNSGYSKYADIDYIEITVYYECPENTGCISATAYNSFSVVNPGRACDGEPGNYAKFNNDEDWASYSGFDFPDLPSGATVTGIEVNLKGSTGGSQLDVYLNEYDGTDHFSAAKTTAFISPPDYYTLGGPFDTWGYAWDYSDFNDTTTFQVYFDSLGGGGECRLYEFCVTVFYYEAGGGNTPPVAVDDYYSTDEDIPLVVSAPGVLSNDSDADSDPLTIPSGTAPGHGTLVLLTSGGFTYTPDPNFNGPDSFTYNISDGNGGTDTATVYITVDPVNDPPVADAQAVSTDEDTAKAITLTGSDGDPEVAQTLTFAIDTSPSHGALSGFDSSTGAVTYTPDLNYNGPDSFTFTVTDDATAGDPASLTSLAATVDITVNPVNDCPIIDYVSPATQTVQFSDLIQTITIVAHDIDNDLGDLDLGYVPYGLSVDDSTPGTWIISGQFMDDHATDWIIGVTDGECETPAATITSLEECAVVRFDNHNPKGVEIGDVDTVLDTNAEFTVHIKQDPDGYLGWANLESDDVEMNIIPVGGGPSIPMHLDSWTELSVFATGGEVSFTFTPLDSDPDFDINTYIVEVTIDNDYYRACGGEDILVVYDPEVGTTGFGSFIWPEDGSDMEGGEAEFAYVMNYNKKGKNVRGSLLLIVRMDGGTIYRIKSNALYDLAVDTGCDDKGGFEWASFSGKCTYIGPDCEVDAYGNLINKGGQEFVVYVKDYDTESEPNNTEDLDEFWFTVLGRAFTLDEDGDNTANEIVEIGETDDIIIPDRPDNIGGNGDVHGHH